MSNGLNVELMRRFKKESALLNESIVDRSKITTTNNEPTEVSMNEAAAKTVEQPVAEQAAADKKPKNDSVSNKVTKFILSYLTQVAGGKDRSVNIGSAALHSADVVRKPIAAGTDVDSSQYTAWAGTNCTKLMNLGLIAKVMVPNPEVGTGRGKARKELVYYQATEAGRQWLVNNK